jgi:hypothetical protein
MSDKTKIVANRRWVGLMFAVVMFAVGGTCTWLGVASARTQVSGWWMPLLIGFIALVAACGAAVLMLNEWRHAQPLETSAGPRYRLRPDATALLKFLGWLGLALVANLFINVAIIALVAKGPATPGRLAVLAVFWLAFATPSAALIVPTIRHGRRLLGRDRTLLDISSPTLRLGDQPSVLISHWSRVGVQKIVVTVLHQAHRRTRSRIIARMLYKRGIYSCRRLEVAECQPWQQTITLDIPPTGLPSGREREYGDYHSWDIVVDVTPTGRPAYQLKFPLTVIR